MNIKDDFILSKINNNEPDNQPPLTSRLTATTFTHIHTKTSACFSTHAMPACSIHFAKKLHIFLIKYLINKTWQ